MQKCKPTGQCCCCFCFFQHLASHIWWPVATLLALPLTELERHLWLTNYIKKVLIDIRCVVPPMPVRVHALPPSPSPSPTHALASVCTSQALHERDDLLDHRLSNKKEFPKGNNNTKAIKNPRKPTKNQNTKSKQQQQQRERRTQSADFFFLLFLLISHFVLLICIAPMLLLSFLLSFWYCFLL